MSPLKICPICGSKKIARTIKTLNLRTSRHVVRVPGVAVDRCKNCGEEILDADASRKIDAVVSGGRRVPGRRKTA